MACSNCLGAGLKLDGDGNPALNPDPTGGLAVSAATCLASVKTRRPFGLGTKEQPSGAGCGQGLHIDSGGTLWASQPGYHTQAATITGVNASATPASLGGTGQWLMEDLTWSVTNVGCRSGLWTFLADHGRAVFNVTNGDEFSLQARVELTVSPSGGFDTGWKTHAEGAGVLAGGVKFGFAVQPSYNSAYLLPGASATIRWRKQAVATLVGAGSGIITTSASTITVLRHDSGGDE